MAVFFRRLPVNPPSRLPISLIGPSFVFIGVVTTATVAYYCPVEGRVTRAGRHWGETKVMDLITGGCRGGDDSSSVIVEVVSLSKITLVVRYVLPSFLATLTLRNTTTSTTTATASIDLREHRRQSSFLPSFLPFIEGNPVSHPIIRIPQYYSFAFAKSMF